MLCCSSKKAVVIEPQTPKVDYSITIKTGDQENSATNGPVYINIFGSDHQSTGDLILTDSSNDKSFLQSSIKIIQVKAINIGKPQSIIIRHEDNTNGWFLDYVEISVHNCSIRFIANRWLNSKKNDHKLSVELFGTEQQAAVYAIELQTGNEQLEPLDSTVYVQLYGSTTQTPKIFLEPKTGSFTKGSITKFDISSTNVGEIRKVTIGHEGDGIEKDWYLKSVKIQTIDNQLNFNINKWLSTTKDNQNLFIELNRNEHRSASPPFAIYSVKIQTGDVEQTNRIENIQMSIQGSNGQTEKFLLKDYVKSNKENIFFKGNLDEFEIQHRDIGKIENIIIGYDDDDDDERQSYWLLETVDIETKETTYHFQAQCWLSTCLEFNSSWITMKPDTNNDNVNYKVIIKIGKCNTNSLLVLCINGDKNTTKNIPLRILKDGTRAKFNKDSHFEFNLKDVDVGKIQKIRIGHDGKQNGKNEFLKSVVIEKNNEKYIFQVDRYLNKEQGNFLDLLPLQENHVLYKITIVTSSETDSGTDSGVFMRIYGEKNQTEEFQLIKNTHESEELFKQGNTDRFEIQLNDVGQIDKINIRQDGHGFHPIWHVKSVEIEKNSKIYKFDIDKILDFSMMNIDLTPKSPNNSPVHQPMKRPSQPSIPSKKPMPIVNEMIYKVSVRFGALQKNSNNSNYYDNDQLYVIIVGEHGQTKKLPLLLNKYDEVEFKTSDVGKVSKIYLGQSDNKNQAIRHIDNLIVKRGDETTIFNVQCSIEQNSQIELTPTSVGTPSDKLNDIDYEIKTVTGDKTYDGGITLKIRGEFGIIEIPLSHTVTGEKPFQSRATDQFKCRTNDVGKIKRFTIKYNGSQTDNYWHLKKLVIKRGKESYGFDTNIRLDHNEQHISLYPQDHKKDDFVQSELRRLKQNLHSESLKMRRPLHKVHEPFVYNDLKPYFDTTSVEKAIQEEPPETTTGYYTRLTALRIVEPWEAFGMDYGVNYELLKQRRLRGHSARRPTIKTDESIDRTQGSTHLPEFPCVNMQKPAEYHRPLTLNDVSNIRSYIRTHSALRANYKKEKDYKRTQDDFYRMQLDNVAVNQAKNRENMVRVYQSYLGTTPGSRKAVRDLCDQLPLNATKTSVESAV